MPFSKLSPFFVPSHLCCVHNRVSFKKVGSWTYPGYVLPSYAKKLVEGMKYVWQIDDKGWAVICEEGRTNLHPGHRSSQVKHMPCDRQKHTDSWTFRIDFDERTCTIVQNEKNLGVAHKDVPDEFMIALSSNNGTREGEIMFIGGLRR